MLEKEISIHIEVYNAATELPRADAGLIEAAEAALHKSYAPYSGFKVAAAALLQNGVIVSGANQENAAYPMCLCAEAVTISACSAQYPGVAIEKMAITTSSGTPTNGIPTAPCGQCRQTLLEYELRQQMNIEIIMSGENGQVYKVASVKELLPLYFSSMDLK
jgi:cytidine deaminase